MEAGPRPRTEYQFADADPVNIQLGLVMIDNVALASISGEVFTQIAQHLRKESPFQQTIMVTHANGSSGYIPSDAAFDQVGYEVTTSRLKPGCAENAIVNGFLAAPRAFALRVRIAPCAWASLASAAGSALMVTSRFSLRSRARYTSPMPPAPRGATISASYYSGCLRGELDGCRRALD
jgi:hypothetical protein